MTINIDELQRENEYLKQKVGQSKDDNMKLTKAFRENKHEISVLQDKIQTYKRRFSLIRDGLDTLRSELDTMEETE